MRRLIPALTVTSWFLAPVLALAVATAYWEVDSFDQFNKGEPVEAVLSSRGEVRPGLTLENTALEAEGIWDILLSNSGNLFLATGNSGKLWRIEKGKPVLDYETKKLVITSLAEDPQGNLFFAAIPQGVIFRRSASGQVSKWAETKTDYVWTLLYDPARGLVAGTGPEGKVLLISAKDEVKTLTETGAEHVLWLARDREGNLYGGTSGKGLLFSLSPKGIYRIEESFEEGEVKRVVPMHDATGEWFCVGVNQARGRGGPGAGPSLLKKPAPASADKSAGSDEGGDSADEEGESKGGESLLPALKEMMPGGAPGKLSGKVYAVRLGQGRRELLSLPGAAVTDLAVDGKGAIFAATDQNGKIYRIEPQDTIYAVEFDLKAEQTLALELESGKLRWIGSGMPGGVVRVTDKPSAKAEYYSEVFDAGFPARWGKFTLRSEGKVEVETRSGATKEPNQGWSEWQALPSPGQVIASPSARYLQARATWSSSSQGVLQAFSAAYAVANQPHYLDLVEVGNAPERPADKPAARPAGLDSEKREEGPSAERDRPARPSAGSSTRLQLRWKVTNPDGDPLVFELFYQPEGFSKWIPIHSDKEITRTRYEWETESIPDGYYRIKVRASDWKANPPDQVIIAERESEPFLVDNRRPEVGNLKVAVRNLVSGTARDQTSPIVRIEYSLDGQDWTPVAAADGILDEKEEDFEFRLPALPAAGPHTLAVRAFDKAENSGVNQISFTVP